ncbi:MAG: L,D-transpeptidase [Comamonas sp.]
MPFSLPFLLTWRMPPSFTRFFGRMALALCLGAAAVANAGQTGAASQLSDEAQQVAHWISTTQDNQRLPYVLIDKRAARVHVFDAAGRLQASSAVLLGLARGDHSVPGIGERPMSAIAPHERTTPAGRFLSEPGQNLQGEDIVWIDYDAAVSMHRVRSGKAAERRLQRLATATVADNRISYGCVNVPQQFYDRNVAPVLGKKPGVIYVLPETQAAASFFGFDAARGR